MAEDPRPSLDAPLERLLTSLCERIEPLAGVNPRSILPVAASAWGTAAASVRSLDPVAARVHVGGRRRRWELALRPVFFNRGDPGRRLSTLVHELLHLDPSHPGRLLDDNRHDNRSQASLDREAKALADQWLAEADNGLLGVLGHQGEARMLTWLHRPIEGTADRTFGSRDVVEAIVTVRTPAEHRSVWWS